MNGRAIEQAQRTLERCHETQCDVVRRVVAVLWREVLADLADDQVAARRLREVASCSHAQTQIVVSTSVTTQQTIEHNHKENNDRPLLYEHAPVKM